MTEAAKKPSGLHVKLSELYAIVTNIEKHGTAPQAMGGFAFVQASDAAAVIRRELAERWLTMLPESMTYVDGGIVVTSSGKQLLLAHMHVTWRITDGETGESCTIESWGSGSDGNDKAIPKAITNAMKYAILAGFMIPQGDDPEREDQAGANGGIVGRGQQQAQPQRLPDHYDRHESFQPLQEGPGSPMVPRGAPVGGNPACEACGAIYNGRPGDYWHRAPDGTTHRPAGQRRMQS